MEGQITSGRQNGGRRVTAYELACFYFLAIQGQVACRQGRFESPEKRTDVIVVRIMIQDLIEDPFVAAIIHCRQNAVGAIIHFIGGDIARKIRQGPVKEVRVQARLRLFFP